MRLPSCLSRRRSLWVGAALLAVLLAACSHHPTSPPTVPPPPVSHQLASQRIASGLAWPVFVTEPPGDTARLFIVEQGGRILVLKNGALLPTPFLDATSLTTGLSGGTERGLLGLAFAPDYATSGYFWVDYTNTSGNTVIARYHVSSDPDVADPASAATLLVIGQPYANHNGGTLAFGPRDGYLYIGMGDGGSGGDPGNRAQADTTLLGKMLRIDARGAFPFAIPPDNPFAGQGPPMDRVWAKGLRNPYRFSFDPQGGDLYIADAGQDLWEEVDWQPGAATGGENYGWHIMEGDHCYDPPAGCNETGLTLPVHEYGHDVGCVVVGGVVYRGPAMPWLQGNYFFGDFCSGRIWSFRMVGGAATGLTEWTAALAPATPGQSIANVSAIGVDSSGEMIIVDRGTGADGELWKIVPASSTAARQAP